MAAAGLALLLVSLGVLSHGLRILQDEHHLEKPSAEAKDFDKSLRSKQKELRVAGMKMMKARRSLTELMAELTDTEKEYQEASNKSAVYRAVKKEADAKVLEVAAENAVLKQRTGKHAIFNKTLAQERKMAGDTNISGLWIITDEPPTAAEKEKRARERKLRKTVPQRFDVTHLQEVASTYGNLQTLHEVRKDFYADKAQSLKASIQAEMQNFSESSDVVKELWRALQEFTSLGDGGSQEGGLGDAQIAAAKEALAKAKELVETVEQGQEKPEAESKEEADSEED